MTQLNFHNTNPLTPRSNLTDLPILTCFKETYKLWHEHFNHLSRPTRYTLGAKIDNLFTDIIQLLLNAGYLKYEEKIPLLKQASNKLDSLKYFLTILWELKGIKNGPFAQITDKLVSGGKMLGGWLKLPQK